MKHLLLFIPLLIFHHLIPAQTGHFDDFADIDNWWAETGYTLSNPDNEVLQVDAVDVGPSFEVFSYTFPSLNLTNHPYVQVKIRSIGATSVRVRIDLEDESGRVTNANPRRFIVSGTNPNYVTYLYDFSGRFTQSEPSSAVDPTQIHRIVVYLNPGMELDYNGTVFFDSLRIGSAVTLPPLPKEIRLNQIGFYPDQTKTAVFTQPISNTFYIVSENKQDTLFQGTAGTAAIWNHSGETVSKADFSNFSTPGNYYIAYDDEYSHPFSIRENIHTGLTKGLLKSFYFNRASTDIELPWAEQWPRTGGHPDNEVLIHASAATEHRPEGTVISSPGGWYDAGDYNKYMVNSGITTYNLLSLYEHYPAYFDTLNLFIPESDNNLPDILDEILYNLRWMLSAQDPEDGSVYHKVTDPFFVPAIMPDAYVLPRYAVGRSTSAALNLAAVAAQAARIFSAFEAELPGFADSCLNAAVKAYEWASANPGNLYTANPQGISTGAYEDNNISDEFNWARVELYITTKDESYYIRSPLVGASFFVPDWRTVNSLWLCSIINSRKQLTEVAYGDTITFKTRLLNMANGFRNYSLSSAYGTPMGQSTWNFIWGSNAYAGNMGAILLQAYRLTEDESYFKAALANLDYLLGRNATGYSFVTGYGSKPPRNPHHRISQADGVADPIPGTVPGGANSNHEDHCPGYPVPSTDRARSYLDTYCSYSTNEPTINYTSATTYLAGGVEGILSGASYTPPAVTGAKKNAAALSFLIFPNPARDHITIRLNKTETGKVTITDTMGKVWLEENFSGSSSDNTFNIERLPGGIYIISLITETGTGTCKLIK